MKIFKFIILICLLIVLVIIPIPYIKKTIYKNQVIKFINDKKNVHDKFSKLIKFNNLNEPKSIPKIIFQTYKDKNKIPRKIYDNIKKFAPDYEHIIFDDNEAIEFIKKNYSIDALNTYKNLKVGAFKADLLRYCLLYKYGGVYLDIKTELIIPLSKIFTKNYLYSVLSINELSIYQGILASPPDNILFKALIDDIIYRHKSNLLPTKTGGSAYIILTKIFYKYASLLCGKMLNEGLNKNKLSNINIYLFKEHCKGYFEHLLTKKSNKCYDGLDKYGLCCFVNNKNNNNIIKTRYSDYPW